jgi:hypothetical protein
MTDALLRRPVVAVLDNLLEKVFAGRSLQAGKHRARTRNQPRRLGIERMEARTLLSANINFFAGGGNSKDLATVALLGSHSLPGRLALPATPSLSATSVSTSQITLAWSAVAGAQGYLVDYWAGYAWQQIGSFGSGTTGCSVIRLNPGATYSFEVAAYNSAGTSWSTAQTAMTSGGNVIPPANPSFTATTVSVSQIDLAWSAVSGASGYAVDEWVNGTWLQIATLGSANTVYWVSGLSAGTTYSFDLAAFNSAGATWSTVQTATTRAAAVAAPKEPAAATAYSPVGGSLFSAGGPSYLDVHQGAEGDCWLLSSLAEVAARDPADIQSMFTAAGTTVVNGATVNLYTVRFFSSAGVAQYVTVDTELPSGGGYYDQVTNGVLWVALAEKAYAEANGAGIVTTQNVGSDSYNALNGGDPSWALQAITGKPANDFVVNPGNVVAAWNAGELIVLGSSPNANDNLIVGDSQGTHAYAVVNYNASSNTPFELYNPWGMSSVVGVTTSFNGRQVYDGPFYASAAMVSEDFAYQIFGSGTENGKHSSANVATDLLLARWM